MSYNCDVCNKEFDNKRACHIHTMFGCDADVYNMIGSDRGFDKNNKSLLFSFDLRWPKIR